jgi:hypothetical protein
VVLYLLLRYFFTDLVKCRKSTLAHFLVAIGYSPGNVSRGAWHGYYDTGLPLPDGNKSFCDSTVGTIPFIVSKLMREGNEEYGDLEISFKMVIWLCCGIAEGDRYILSITNLFETGR